jgi:hypothetical protein
MECSAVAVIPAISEQAKKFDFEKNTLVLVCPACREVFSVPVQDIVFRQVTDQDLKLGYIVF